MMSNLLQANEEARKVDVANAEAALDRRQTEIDKRQAEIKALADRIAEGQKKIEAEVRNAPKSTCKPAPCSSRWARPWAITRRPPG